LLQTEIEPLKDTLGKHIASSMAQEEVLSMFESQRAYLYGEFEQLRVEIAQEADRRNSIVCLIQDSLDKEREMREFSMSECMMNIRTELSQGEEVQLLQGRFDKIAADMKMVITTQDSLALKMDGKNLESMILLVKEDLSHLKGDMAKESSKLVDEERADFEKKISEVYTKIEASKKKRSSTTLRPPLPLLHPTKRSPATARLAYWS